MWLYCEINLHQGFPTYALVASKAICYFLMFLLKTDSFYLFMELQVTANVHCFRLQNLGMKKEEKETEL